MINVFIDSNILFEDYFFENSSCKRILDYVKSGWIKLHMSEIVRLELRRQFQKEIEKVKRTLNDIHKISRRIKIDHEFTTINIENSLSKFDRFYKQLDLQDYFEIIPLKNDFLPDLVDRAINRKKPFTEEKLEVKDALIWKSYSEYVESFKLDNCILLTNNTNDFCAKKDKSLVHPDLVVDTNRFVVINSAFDFIKQKGETLETPDNKFKAYINQLSIGKRFVLTKIKNNFEKYVEEAIDNEIQHLNPSDLINKDYWFDGYVTAYGTEILNCDEIEIQILSETALISGKLYICSDVELFNYNPAKDHGEDAYSSMGEKNLNAELYFNFNLAKDEICSDFEITSIDLTSVE